MEKEVFQSATMGEKMYYIYATMEGMKDKQESLDDSYKSLSSKFDNHVAVHATEHTTLNEKVSNLSAIQMAEKVKMGAIIGFATIIVEMGLKKLTG